VGLEEVGGCLGTCRDKSDPFHRTLQSLSSVRPSRPLRPPGKLPRAPARRHNADRPFSKPESAFLFQPDGPMRQPGSLKLALERWHLLQRGAQPSLVAATVGCCGLIAQACLDRQTIGHRLDKGRRGADSSDPPVSKLPSGPWPGSVSALQIPVLGMRSVETLATGRRKARPWRDSKPGHPRRGREYPGESRLRRLHRTRRR